LHFLDLSDIHDVFAPLFQLMNPVVSRAFADRILDCSNELISLLLVVLLKKPLYFEYLLQQKLAMRCIIGLLPAFNRCEKVSFLHSIIIVIIGRILLAGFQLNAAFPSLGAIHRGSFGDAIIEILTNPIMNDYSRSTPLLPLAANLIAKISTCGLKLSSFSANRLFVLLKRISGVKPSPESIIEDLLVAIYQVLRSVPLHNIPLLSFAVEHRRLLSRIQVGKEVCQRIVVLANASEEIIEIMDEEKRGRALDNCFGRIFERDQFVIQKRTEWTWSKEWELNWLVWLRTLFLNLRPDLTVTFAVQEVPPIAPASGSWWSFLAFPRSDGPR
jgi:hypothetical protein